MSERGAWLCAYFDHRDDIDRRIADDQALARALRERTPSKVSDRLRSLQMTKAKSAFQN